MSLILDHTIERRSFLDIDYFSYQTGIMELKLLICTNSLFPFFFFFTSIT